jgi:hypothetical protein
MQSGHILAPTHPRVVTSLVFILWCISYLPVFSWRSADVEDDSKQYECVPIPNTNACMRIYRLSMRVGAWVYECRACLCCTNVYIRTTTRVCMHTHVCTCFTCTLMRQYCRLWSRSILDPTHARLHVIGCVLARICSLPWKQDICCFWPLLRARNKLFLRSCFCAGVLLWLHVRDFM